MAISVPFKNNGHFVSRYGQTVNEVFSLTEGLPAAVAGVITLPSGKYIFRESFSIGTDRFYLGPGWTGEITIDDTRNVALTYDGTGTMWTAENSARVAFADMGYILTGSGAQFIDISGAGSFVSFENGIVEFNAANQIIGTISDCFSLYTNSVVLPGFTTGLSIIRGSNINLNNMLMVGSPPSTGPFMSINGAIGPFGPFCSLSRMSMTTTAPGQDIFYIDPTVGATVSLTDTDHNTDGTNFYQIGTTGPIASFTDVSTGTTAVASVADDSGDAVFTSNSHGLVVGETAVHTTFSEATYNVSNQVTAVPTVNTYTAGITYVSNDSGLFETTTCQVDDLSHGRSDTDHLSIFGTVNFDNGYEVFNALTDTFEITLGKAFPGTESTGNWDTGSLTSSDPFVNSLRNGLGVKNSKNIGSFLVDGNTTDTDIVTQYTFEDCNFGTNAVEAGDIEMWTLVDTTTGSMRYDGVFPTSLDYYAVMAASSAGGAQTFYFRLMRSRAGGAFLELPSPDNVNIPMALDSTIRTAPLLWAIEIDPGDIFKMQVANDDGTSDIKLVTVKCSIS